MAKRFLIKDIALQAGVATASVDRVLNRRGNVHQRTIDRVNQAIVELERQRHQLAMTGHKLFVDVIVEAPGSFLDALEIAVSDEIPLMHPLVFRVRNDLRTRFPVSDVEKVMRQVERRGSDGVLLMAPETPGLKRVINRLEAVGIPMVTLATDMKGTSRTAYVGLDNRKAGETVAWFLAKCLNHVQLPRVLVTIRNVQFRGEEEREAGFRTAWSSHFPEVEPEVIVEGTDRSRFIEQVEQARDSVF